MKHAKWFVLNAAVLALGVFAVSAESWQTKPYPEWSVKDAVRVLERSPWVMPFQWSNMQDMMNSRGDSENYSYVTLDPRKTDPASVDPTMKSEREFVLTISVRLFSARPIRQASVVIRANGDKTRLASENLRDFATRDIDDEIIVSWTYAVKPQGHSALHDLDAFLRQTNAVLLKPTVYLTTDTGKRVYLKDYRPPTTDGTGAKFIFPRVLEDGSPLVAATTKSIRFQSGPVPMKDKLVPVDATFKISDLAFCGRTEY